MAFALFRPLRVISGSGYSFPLKTLPASILAVLCLAAASSPLRAKEVPPSLPNAGTSGNPYQRWTLGPNRSKDYFPIAVWCQSPSLAPRYQAAGINLYVGLWDGPTEAQLATLKEHNMPVICPQNEVGLAHLDNPLIVGWMHGDEPDMAHDFQKTWGGDPARIKEAWPEQYKDMDPTQPFKETYGTPYPPSWIKRDYAAFRAKDPQRPVFLNLSVGAAYEPWLGRGTRTGKTEDYPEYVKGCDIASFDIYPANEAGKEFGGQLWYVPKGVTNLRTWTNDQKVVWNCIECTGINDLTRKPRPREVKAEVWMSLIHGSMGLIYFVHQFKPFNDHALLDDPEMLAGVTRINQQIHQLAPVLNSPPSTTPATVESGNKEVPIATMTKSEDNTVFVFAVAMRPGSTQAVFTVPGIDSGTVTVIGEDRTLKLAQGRFEDSFNDWDVHLYKMTR